VFTKALLLSRTRFRIHLDNRLRVFLFLTTLFQLQNKSSFK
jgi:hypothetical protein